jgi:DNA-binding CsgD family transcriptional regulator/N-acetylneuraminic acid mutarotase
MPENNELSERELEILRLVATGASNKEIAQQLYISPNTVKVHLKNIFSKIGVTSRTEAAMAAVQMGLVQSVPASITESEVDSVEAGLNGHGIGQKQVSGARHLYSVLGVIALLLLVGSVGYMLVTGKFSPAEVMASPAAPTESPRWLQKAPLTPARTKLALAAYENQVYAIGGEMVGGITGRVERFDPESNSWTRLEDDPAPVKDASAAVIGGKIYVPGGRLASGAFSRALQIYDPITRHWTEGALLPKAISAYAMVAFEGSLYLFGGLDGSNYLNTVYKYTPNEAGGEWQLMKSKMPTARAYAGAAIAGGRIYVIGGYDGQRALTVNEAYQPAREDTADNPWFTKKSMPAGRYGMGIASLADIIHIIGGVGEDQEPLQPLKYFPQPDQWQILDGEAPTELQSWSYLQAAPVETYVYAIGGERQGQPATLNMEYKAIYTISIPIVK